MSNSLKDKKVLITGATDGLGKLIAKHLAMRDAEVILHGRNEEKGDQLVDELYKQTQMENYVTIMAIMLHYRRWNH